MKEGKFKTFFSKIQVVIPLLLVGAYASSVDALAPILRNIQVAFPDASLTLVQMTLTLPSAVSIPVQLCTVFLAQYMTKKQMLSTGLILICVGGLIPFFFHSSIIFLVISSCVIGIGQGFYMPNQGALVGELFDGNFRGTVVGIQGGISAFMRSLLTIACGFFGVLIWSRAYIIFFFLIPLIALFIWRIPKGVKGAKIVGKGSGGVSGIKNVLTVPWIVLTILCTCATFSQMAYLINIAGFIADKNLGGAVTAGVATSFNVMARFIIGLSLGILLKGFKRFTLPFGYALNAAGYFVIINANSLLGIQIGGIMFGFGLGIQMAAGTYYMTETVKKEYLSQAFGLYMPFISFAVSVAPAVINTLSKTVFGATTASNNFKIGFMGYCFTASLMFLYQLIFCKDSMIGKISGLESKSELEPESGLESESK